MIMMNSTSDRIFAGAPFNINHYRFPLDSLSAMLSSLIEYETPKVVTVHNISIGETSVSYQYITSYQQANQARWGNTGEKRFKSFILYSPSKIQ